MENQFWRKLIVFGIVLAVSLMLAACGDDDDDDAPAAPASSEEPTDGSNPDGSTPDGNIPPEGDGDVAPVEMLDLYDFTLRIQGVDPFLTLTQPAGEIERALVVSNRGGGDLTGTYDPAAGQVTFNGGSNFVLTATNYWGDATLDSVPVLVEEDIVFQEDSPGMQDSFPVQGSFSFRYAVNTVVVDFVNEDTPGVRLMRNDEPEVFYNADEFDDLLDANVMVWQQKAVVVFQVMEFLAEQTLLMARTGETINTREGDLEENTSIAFECGTFPEDSEDSEPSLTLTWLDADESGEISDGDAFRWEFVLCWNNDEGALIDDLMNGRIDLLGYVSDSEQRDGQDVVTRFGFEPEVQTTAGVVYTDLVQTEIEEETPDILSIDPKRTYIVNGGYTIVFSEPAEAQ